MKFNKTFFENTRLGILSKAALVTDTDGNVMYLNRAFAKLSRENPGVRLEIAGEKRENPVLVKNDITLFGEEMTVYIEKGNTDFPLFENGTIYFTVETDACSIKLPLFGGKVEITDKNAEARVKTNEPIADINTEYFLIDMIFARIAENIREKSCHSGRRLEFGEIDTSNMICKASVFDVSLVMGLLVNSAYRLSSDKTVTVSAGKVKSDFVFDVSVITDIEIKDGRSLVSKMLGFDNALVSLESFCSLFSYHLMCRKSGNKLSIALAIPVQSTVSVSFRNEDERKIFGAADRAALLY